jgi:hypothetical protein
MTVRQMTWNVINKVYILFRTKGRLLRNRRSTADNATKPQEFLGIDSLDSVVPFKNHL